MDAFERSAEDELGCLGSDSDGEASHDAERQRRLVIGNGPTKRRRWWCSVAGRGRAWAKWPGATGCRLIR